MTDPNQSAVPAARPRPGTVTIAGYLLYLVAAIQLIGLVVALSMLGTLSDVLDEAYAGTDMAGAGVTAANLGLIGGAVLGLIIAIGLVVLAVLNNRGKNPARIVTWVLGGLFFCCSAAGLGLSAAGSAFAPPSSSDPNVPDQAEIQQMIEDRLPSWYTPVTTLLSVIALIAVLVALILLALPPSNEFFRKAQPVWEPPVPGSAYPGYPQYGYPQSGYPQSGPPQGYPPQQSGPPSGDVPQANPPSGNPSSGDVPPTNPSGGGSDDQWGRPSPPPSGPPTS